MLKSQLLECQQGEGGEDASKKQARSHSQPDMTSSSYAPDMTSSSECQSVVGSLCDAYMYAGAYTGPSRDGASAGDDIDDEGGDAYAPRIGRQGTGVPRDLVYARTNGSVNGDFERGPTFVTSSQVSGSSRLRRSRSGEDPRSTRSTSSSSHSRGAVTMPMRNNGGRGRGQEEQGFFHPPTPAIRPGMRMVNGRSRSFNKDLVNLFNQSVQQSQQNHINMQNGNIPPSVNVRFDIDESHEEQGNEHYGQSHNHSSTSHEALKKYYAWLKFQAANREVLLNIKPPKVEAWKKKSQLRSPPIHLVIYVLGSERSGKRSLVKSFVRPEQYKRASKIPDNGTKSIKNVHVTIDNRRYILEIRTPPQVPIDLENHPTVVKQRIKSYEGVHAFLLCYSVFWSPALDAIKDRWIPEIQSAFLNPSHLGDKSGRSTPPFIIVGTKTDARPGYPGYKPDILASQLEPDEAPAFVDFLDAKCIAQECGAEKYLECTARVGNAGANGVNAVFAAAINAGRMQMKTTAHCVQCFTCSIL